MATTTDITQILDTSNSDFIKEYAGKIIYDQANDKNYLVGDTGELTYLARDAEGYLRGEGYDYSNASNSPEVISFENGGLTDQATIKDMYKYNLVETEGQTTASANNYGLGVSDGFRSRNEGEDMASYLAAKQAWEIENLGSSGVDLVDNNDSTVSIAAVDNTQTNTGTGNYFYSGTQLASNLNKNAVNALYNYYFDRDASQAELDNWTGTSVKGLEDFLQSEQQKYSYTSNAQKANAGTGNNFTVEMPEGAIDAGEISSTPESSQYANLSQKQQDILDKIIASYESAGADAGANEAFIQAVAQVAKGRAATASELSLAGQSLSKVISYFGIGSLIPDFGVSSGSSTNYGSQIATPEILSQLAAQGLTEGDIIRDGNTIYLKPGSKYESILSGLTAGGGATGASGELNELMNNVAEEDQDSIYQQILDKAKEILGIKDESYAEKAEELGLEEKSQAITDLETEYQDRKEYYEAEEEKINSQTIPQTQIDRQLNQLSMTKNKELANLSIRLEIAQGNYDRAQEIAKEYAQDAYDSAVLELEYLQLAGEISEAQAEAATAQLEYQRDLALDGYIEVTDESQLEGLTEQDIMRDPVSGKIYIRPIDTEIITSNGRKLLINSNTGATIKDLGSSTSGSGSSTTTTYKFKDEDRERLFNLGLNASEVNEIQDSINEFGLEATASALEEVDQAEVATEIRNILKGVEAPSTDQDSDEMTEEERKQLLEGLEDENLFTKSWNWLKGLFS